MKNGYKGNGSVARRVLSSGTGSTNGIMPRIGYGGGDKKGGSGPTATGFMKPYYYLSNYPTGPGRVNYVMRFRTSARPAGALTYVNAYSK